MICFDLEGPLSPQDNAYEVMKLAENGGLVFEALSEYDDTLALQGKSGYEPGDTLRLAVPFLMHYGITEGDIRRVSKGAVLVPGMKETVSWIKEGKTPLKIISTSYQQHAHTIGQRLGVSVENIASTKLNLDDMQLDPEIVNSLEEIERGVVTGGLTDECIQKLDELYFSQGLFEKTKVLVVGGQRKVDALVRFAEEEGKDLSRVAAVGDSITDYKMLREVSKKGGLAVAFNANKYCLPYADVAIATVDGRAVLPILREFIDRGREEAIEKARGLEHNQRALDEEFNYLLALDPKPRYNVVDENSDIEEVLKVHNDLRMRVRGEAGKLG